MENLPKLNITTIPNIKYIIEKKDRVIREEYSETIKKEKHVDRFFTKEFEKTYFSKKEGI